MPESYTLALNAFRAHFPLRDVDLPVLTSPSWEASTQLLRTNFGGFEVARDQRADGSVRLAALSGPPDVSLERTTLNIEEEDLIGRRLIELAVAQYGQTLGMRVSSGRFDTSVLRPAPEIHTDAFEVSCGISAKAKRPFASEPASFYLLVNWIVRATFTKDLTDSALRAMSVGCGVLFRPRRPIHELTPELKKFRGRFLGHVREIKGSAEAVVLCRDDALRLLPCDELVLEASPSAIREYELRTGATSGPKSAWYRIQELAFVFTAQGRRNPAVLKDRLNAIRNFLPTGSPTGSISLPLPKLVGGEVIIDFQPSVVPVATHV
jgi:hypothetical protein